VTVPVLAVGDTFTAAVENQIANALNASTLINPTNYQFANTLVGAAWDGVSQLIVQQFNPAVTTGGTGRFSVNYPIVFPNGLLSVVAQGGGTASLVRALGISYADLTLSAFFAYVREVSNGLSVNSTGLTVSITAVGW
jgi:hypothetical protein